MSSEDWSSTPRVILALNKLLYFSIKQLFHSRLFKITTNTALCAALAIYDGDFTQPRRQRQQKRRLKT